MPEQPGFPYTIISIHAPREGSDLASISAIVMAERISIHAPREGSDPKSSISPRWKPRFQSTLPVRGATFLEAGGQIGRQISIHAPREGSDLPYSGFSMP